MRLPRPTLLLAAVAAPLLAAGTAAAQGVDGGTGSSSWAAGDFFIGVQQTLGANLSNFDVARFFNKARCDCSETVYVYVALTNSGFAKRTTVDRSGNIEFWVGSACDNIFGRDARCVRLGSPTLQAFLNDGRATMETNARVLSTYTVAGATTTTDGGVFTPNPDCTLPTGIQSFSQTIFVIINSSQGSPQSIASRQISIDLTPPPQPTDVKAEGGHQAVNVSWTGVDSSLITDVLGYQVLCNRGGELQVFDDNTFEPGYSLCGNSVPADAGVQELHPFFTCSPLLSPTSRSFRVKILQNDITYGVTVVAIDRSGNPSTPDIFYAKATKSLSFYDVYRDGDNETGGAATGGLCTVSAETTARGAAAGLAATLALAAIAVVRRRRRRK
jgi:hypothetical protein